MLRKALLACVFATGLTTLASAADIVVRVRPPHAQVERRPVRPSREHVWTPGYHRWEGNAYVWTPGAWVAPPRPRAHWVSAHWARRGHEWVFVEGHWR